MNAIVRLPRPDGSITTAELRPRPELPAGPPPSGRVAYAAAHVVADPRKASAGDEAALDWDATLRARQRLWSAGLGVAEAMDTAQRGMGMTWPVVRELIARSAKAAREAGGTIAAGVATDQLPPGETRLDAILDAYREQLAAVREHGATPVLMASRHLAAAAADRRDHFEVYSTLIEEAGTPVILHWLGEAFDPALRGYWGSTDLDAAERTVLELIATAHPGRVDGIKLSLLDRDREIALRRRLPDGVRMYTGDDFNYVDLIAGDAEGHSDALLGAFAAVPEIAGAALRLLDAGDADGYRALLGPTQELSRKVFEAPTYYYKTGITWLAYLGGYQDHFRMVAGLESGRSLVHLAELTELAGGLGLFADPGEAAARHNAYMRVHGIG